MPAVTQGCHAWSNLKWSQIAEAKKWANQSLSFWFGFWMWGVEQGLDNDEELQVRMNEGVEQVCQSRKESMLKNGVMKSALSVSRSK